MNLEKTSENHCWKDRIKTPMYDRDHSTTFFWHPSAIGKDLLSIEKFGLVRYMILKAVCAFFAFLLELFGVYGDGEFKWHYGSAYGKVTQETIEGSLKLNEDDEKPAVLEETETQVEAPGTSIRESVQDIVVEGGQRVVKDVVLTISQAMGPMAQGVMRIQQTFHRKSEASEEEESVVEVGKEVTGNLTGDENKIDV